MATIGVYDSGIGGLTSAATILENFAGNNIYYFADNLHHPFGNMPEDRLKNAIAGNINRVKRNCDALVIACNTASSVIEDKELIKLLPPLDGKDKETTLLLATDRTIKKLGVKDKFRCGDTPELASLVEIVASLNKGSLDMELLYPYFTKKLKDFENVKEVVIGCSHYEYCRKEIKSILHNETFDDGNQSIIDNLNRYFNKNEHRVSKIKFVFSLGNESVLYEKILRNLTDVPFKTE